MSLYHSSCSLRNSHSNVTRRASPGRGKKYGEKYGKKVREKSTGEKSRDFRWRHFRSRDCRQFLSLPVAPRRSSANTNLSVPIYYCSDHFVKTTRTPFWRQLGPLFQDDSESVKKLYELAGLVYTSSILSNSVLQYKLEFQLDLIIMFLWFLIYIYIYIFTAIYHI